MGEKEPTCLRRVVGTSLSSAERYGATVTSLKMQLSRRGSYVLPRIYFSVLGGDMGCVLEYHRCVFLFESDFFKPTSTYGLPSTPPPPCVSCIRGNRRLSDEQTTAELPPEERRVRPGVQPAAPVADGRGGRPQREVQLHRQGSTSCPRRFLSVSQHFSVRSKPLPVQLNAS